ncbi:HNH endonuclease [Anabaena sp. PCC 7108]|uniref:HNH endonuclease n=1 Tax=Anabaena sp. PCC 7108 TaxID=163908 RepID=UPI00034DCD2A|nr:HNH endonuclease signature motif containing protein [Anabaena sp. PCC 7108]
MGFPDKVAEKALLDCGRCCCICHKFCGFKIELHHIIQKSEGGEDLYENCIPLCFDCHAEIKAYDPQHPKGRKYNVAEIIEHRNRWYETVKNQTFVVINPDCIKLDRKLFLKIKETLPSTSGSLFFMRGNCNINSFKQEVHDDLFNYIALCRHPDFEFIDSDLEIRRCQLTDCIEEYLDLVNYGTYPRGMRLYVNPDKFDDRDRHYQVIEDLALAANKVCSAYDDLVRLGRTKLGVE